MGISNEVGEAGDQCSGQQGRGAVPNRRASFPSRQRHYAVRRKTRTHSPPLHQCNRVPPQLPPAELACDSDDSDSSAERQEFYFVIPCKLYRLGRE